MHRRNPHSFFIPSPSRLVFLHMYTNKQISMTRRSWWLISLWRRVKHKKRRLKTNLLMLSIRFTSQTICDQILETKTVRAQTLVWINPSVPQLSKHTVFKTQHHHALGYTKHLRMWRFHFRGCISNHVLFSRKTSMDDTSQCYRVRTSSEANIFSTT